MTPAVVGALLGAVVAAAPVEPRVAVRFLDRSAPAEVLVEGRGRALQLAAQGDALLRDGAPSAQPLALPSARWRVRIAGEPDREYVGVVEARAEGGAVRLALLLPLERYVAGVVASELPPGTPPEAMRAQAVVARSFALAARGRHAGDRLCDLAHCQVLRGHGIDAEHRVAAATAAHATAGQVLRLRSGRVAEAVYHGSCGGHTADPVEVFGGGGEATGAAAVPDPGCAGPGWSARIPLDVLLGVARERFAAADTEGPPERAWRSRLDHVSRPSAETVESPSDLTLVRGAGGWVVQVRSRDGARTSGDGFARALDRALGWGQVRSARFHLAADPGGVRLGGSGLGHGVGLCQAGAARRALGGESYPSILRHYFPQATLGRVSAITISRPMGPPLPRP